MKRMWLVAALMVLIGAGGFGLLWATQSKPDSGLAGDALQTMPAFVLPDLDGVDRSSAEWQGKVLLVNFWATWCPPCRKEMPHFVDAQNKYGKQGFQVVGIAIDDPAMVKDFVDVYGINFPVMLGEVDAMKLSTQMGNRFETLPYSALYNRQGEVVLLRAGAMTSRQLAAAIEPLLDKG